MHLHLSANNAGVGAAAWDQTMLCPTPYCPAVSIDCCPINPGIAADVVLHLPKHSRQYVSGREGSLLTPAIGRHGRLQRSWALAACTSRTHFQHQQSPTTPFQHPGAALCMYTRGYEPVSSRCRRLCYASSQSGDDDVSGEAWSCDTAHHQATG